MDDFYFLHVFSSWKLPVDQLGALGRGGEIRGSKLLKWEFCVIAAEYIMSYVDQDEVQEITILHSISSYHTTKENCNTILATRNLPKNVIFPWNKLFRKREKSKIVIEEIL